METIELFHGSPGEFGRILLLQFISYRIHFSPMWDWTTAYIMKDR